MSCEEEAFIQRFESALIPRSGWTHAAHIKMAYLYLKQYGDWQTALPIVRRGIQKLNQANKVYDGYHETITVSFLRIMADRLKHPKNADWTYFEQNNSDLFDYRLPIFLRYYAKETIFSAEARERFVTSDLIALP